jgi:polyhydroxyalkanoate synthesis regulator phasin
MKQTKIDRTEKLNALSLNSEKYKLIYEWVKTGKLPLKEFLELIEELKQQEQ